MPEATVQRSNSYAQLPPLNTHSLKSIKRRSYDPSYSRRETVCPVPGPPGHAPNEHYLRRSVSSQPIYPSMLAVLDHHEIYQRPATTSPKPRKSRNSYCESETVTKSLANIKSSTLNMFDTIQEALMRAENAEKQAKASMLKWRTAVTELDRLRYENLLVRNKFETCEAECCRLRGVLEQLSSPSESSISDVVSPSVSSSATKRVSKLIKNGRKAR